MPGFHSNAGFPKGATRDDLGDIAACMSDLRDRITAPRPELSGADAILGVEYLAYFDLVDAAYAAFRAATKTRWR